MASETEVFCFASLITSEEKMAFTDVLNHNCSGFHKGWQWKMRDKEFAQKDLLD